MAHITRYGRQYSNQEWSDMQSNFAEEAAQASEYADKVEQAMQEAKTALVAALGIENGKAYDLAYRLYRYGTDGITFSTTEKQQAVEAISKQIARSTR